MIEYQLPASSYSREAGVVFIHMSKGGLYCALRDFEHIGNGALAFTICNGGTNGGTGLGTQLMVFLTIAAYNGTRLTKFGCHCDDGEVYEKSVYF